MNIYAYLCMFIHIYIYSCMKNCLPRSRTRLPDANSNMECHHSLFHSTHLPQAIQ